MKTHMVSLKIPMSVAVFAGILFISATGISGKAPHFIEREIPLGKFNSSSAVADMNGDGIDDVISLGYRILRINYGNPVAPLDSVVTMESDEFMASFYLFVGDVNNDSIPDLVTGSSVYLGDGDGGYTPSAHFGLAGVRSVATGYINDDEYIDVVLGRLNPNSIGDKAGYDMAVLLGNANGEYDYHHTIYIPNAYHITPYIVHDFNHDGFGDIALTCQSNHGSSISAYYATVGILHGIGEGFLSNNLYFLSEEWDASVVIPSVCDFNGDGFPDILVSNESQNCKMLLNNGYGAFSLAWQLSQPLVSSLANCYFSFDYDGDGDKDIGMVRLADYRNLESTDFFVLENYGNGNFSNLLTVQNDTPIRYVFHTGDFNGDGHDDFIFEDTLYLYTDNPVEVETQPKPESTVSLHQNMPNPFNGRTVIPYTLHEPGFLTMKIFNVLGQEIRLLASGRQHAGSYRISWDGRDNNGESVANGLYYCVLKNNTSISTIKLNYLK